MAIRQTHLRRKALGITLGATPDLRELRDQAKAKLDSGAPREEVEAWLCDVAVNHPLIGLKPFLGVNRKLARASAATLIRELGEYLQGLVAKKRVQDLLSAWAHNSSLDRWLADFILGWIDEGEPPALDATNVHSVWEMKFGPKGEQSTMVCVMCNAIADPREVAQDFLDQCGRSFPAETWSRRGVALEHAQRVKLFAEDLSDTDIARRELMAEGFDLRAADEREFNREVQTRANSVFQSRKRWLEYVTKLTEPVSPDSE